MRHIHARIVLTELGSPMAARRYRMTARSAAVEATRASLVHAAMRLHETQGVLPTSWDDIAAAAGVSTATAYRHFPSLAELVPACARVVFDIIGPPTVEEASVQFATMADAADRFEHLARESCHCYRRGEGWLHAAHRERDFVPELDRALTLIQDTLHVLVDAAAGRRPTRQQHAALFTVCDFPFWKSLVDNGMGYAAAEATVVRTARRESARLGPSNEEHPHGKSGANSPRSH
jgi:AcrR family transcriptional regulator